MRFKIDWASLIVGSEFTVFAFFLLLYLRVISLEGRIHTCLGGLPLEGLIHGGAYFRNFTVSQRREVSVKHTFS